MASTVKELQDQIDAQQDTIDEAREILENVYSPESERSDFVDAVSEALDVLSGEEEEEEEDEEEEDENGD